MWMLPLSYGQKLHGYIHRYINKLPRWWKGGTVDVYEFLYSILHVVIALSLVWDSPQLKEQIVVYMLRSERILYLEGWTQGQSKQFVAGIRGLGVIKGAKQHGEIVKQILLNMNTCIYRSILHFSSLSMHMTVRMVFSWRAGVQPQQNFLLLRYPSASEYILFLVRESVK